MISVGYGMYFDSYLHLHLYKDLVRISATDQETIDYVDLFDYLLVKGFTPLEANRIFEEGHRAVQLAMDGMKYSRLQKGNA